MNFAPSSIMCDICVKDESRRMVPEGDILHSKPHSSAVEAPEFNLYEGYVLLQYLNGWVQTDQFSYCNRSPVVDMLQDRKFQACQLKSLMYTRPQEAY
jgi:hypothetical protein